MTTCIESIWEEFNKPLKSFVQRHTKNNQDVDDILQIVFYKIYSNKSMEIV